MDEDYMFINSYYKHQDKGACFSNDGNVKTPRPLMAQSSTPTPTCSSDEEYIKSEVFDGDHFTQMTSRDMMGDVFNISNDFMFSETQDRGTNQDGFNDLEISRRPFSPARYFDLFGDADNNDFEFLSNDGSDQKELKHKECKKFEGTQNKINLNGVLNRRTLCPNLPRMKQVGTILRQSASMPGTRIAVSRMKVRKNASPDSGIQNCSDSSNMSSDSGHHRARSTYSPLEDHRYYARTKRSESPPPLKKRSFDMGSGMRKSNSCNSSSDNFRPIQPKMSILETFLRATCPLDPNKGSDATLATEGMLNLCIREPKPLKKRKPVCHVGNRNILRNLLIKEEVNEEPPAFLIKQEVEEEPPAFPEVDDLLFPADDLSLAGFPIDSLLVDGFGLDAGLSVDDEGIYNISDFASNWNDEDCFQMGSMIELEESVRLQDHQDELCVQHYASTFL